MLSVIIPLLGEDPNLETTLRAILTNRSPCEIIIVAVGASEIIGDIARGHAAKVIRSAISQRATQMNLGAERAAGEVLLFVHADTQLPAAALDEMESALRDNRVVGGAFARRYEPTSAFLNATCFLAELRSRLFGWFLGDQAIFVRRDVFERLGGFRDYDIFEDLDFARRMRRKGRVATLRPPVTSSARRFADDGAFRRTLSDLWLTLRYICGAGPDALARETTGNLSTPPPRVHSQRDGLCPPASPRAHCKDAPYQSADLHEPADGSRLPI